MSNSNADLRSLPAVSSLLGLPEVTALVAAHGHGPVVRAIRDELDDARRSILRGVGSVVDPATIEARLLASAEGSLRPVINATGIVVHTNLGRAPLAEEAIEAVARIARGYATLEYDLAAGHRGERHGHARQLLVALTGAEDAVVVNNNAAAVLLALAALAVGREVIVSRSEIVEIGGGFRVSDVLRQSGARLVEVGTTNRTHLRDYEEAIGPDTAMLLRVHRSNFAIVGFTADVPLDELGALARARGLTLMVDAGSGCLHREDAPPEEATVRSQIAAGADLVAFSGDKLLGGPQAGIVVGTSRAVEPLRRHPLMRAVRPDKLCLAALVATLGLHRDAPGRVPVLRLARAPVEALEGRAERLAGQIRSRRPLDGAAVTSVRTSARLGGGSAPLSVLPSAGVRLAVPGPDAVLARLRHGRPAVVGRIEDGAVVLDLRCVAPEDDAALAEAVAHALADA